MKFDLSHHLATQKITTGASRDKTTKITKPLTIQPKPTELASRMKAITVSQQPKPEKSYFSNRLKPSFTILNLLLHYGDILSLNQKNKLEPFANPKVDTSITIVVNRIINSNWAKRRLNSNPYTIAESTTRKISN